jgi:hypothetical protein
MMGTCPAGLRRCSWILVSTLLVVAGPARAAKDTFNISGFVGRSSSEPASKVVVKLLDESGKVLDMAQTGFFGKYKFEKLKPGLYLLQVGELKLEALVKNKDVRLDIDLSAKDGQMRYLKSEEVAAALSGAAAGGTAGGAAAGPAPGPNDPQLMQTMAGNYWSYEGSTEMKLMLCANGSFFDSSESSYSGRGSDSLGNQTMAWGAAGQSGSRGKWSVQGGPRQGTIQFVYQNGKSATVQFRAIDQQCYQFSAKTLCRVGPPQCQ